MILIHQKIRNNHEENSKLLGYTHKSNLYVFISFVCLVLAIQNNFYSTF